MADRSPFHRALHRARPAAGADIQAAQSQLVADLFGIVVLLAADGVAAPADHPFWIGTRVQNVGVAQDMEHRIGHSRRIIQVEVGIPLDLVGDVDHIAQHGKKVLVDPLDHASVDKRAGRCIRYLQLDAPLLLHDANIESRIALQQLLAVIQVTAAAEYRQRAVAEQAVQPALGVVQQFAHLHLGEYIQMAMRGDQCIDDSVIHDFLQ